MVCLDCLNSEFLFLVIYLVGAKWWNNNENSIKTVSKTFYFQQKPLNGAIVNRFLQIRSIFISLTFFSPSPHLPLPSFCSCLHCFSISLVFFFSVEGGRREERGEGGCFFCKNIWLLQLPSPFLYWYLYHLSVSLMWNLNYLKWVLIKSLC